MASVSGTGDLKYSSRASSKSGYSGPLLACGTCRQTPAATACSGTYLVYVQEGVSRANRHGLYDCPSLHRLVLFCIHQVQDVDQGWPFQVLGTTVGGIVVVVVVVVVEVILFVDVVVAVAVFFCDDASSPVPPSSPPPFPFFSGLFFLVFLLLAGVFVQEENGPVLVSHVGLVRQHQLGQHVLVARDGDGVLMLHDGAPVDVEGGDQDVFDMILVGAARVL